MQSTSVSTASKRAVTHGVSGTTFKTMGACRHFSNLRLVSRDTFQFQARRHDRRQPVRILPGRQGPVVAFPRFLHTTRVAWALREFKLADIGEGITECEVIKWTVQPASKVQSFDPICEVQSDKASVEITSPFDGVVKELLVPEGGIAKVGQGLCLIEVEDEERSEASGVDSQDGIARSSDQSAEASSSTDQGQRTVAQESAPLQEPQQPARRPHPLDPNQPQQLSLPTRVPASNVDILALPSVRHYAKQKGVDLALIAPGSGKAGRIEKKDVDAFVEGGVRTIGGGAETTATQGQDAVVELGRTRYGMWKAMTKSLEIPQFGYTTTLDLTELHNLLPILNANIPLHYLPATHPKNTNQKPLLIDPSALYPVPQPPSIPDSAKYSRLTYLPFLLKTLGKAMMEWPLLRSSINPLVHSQDGQPGPKPTLTVRPTPHISLALSTPTGLYTPTLTNVHTSSVYALASTLSHLAHLGRQTPSGLTVKEMPKRGGTLTVSNVGAIGDGQGAVPRLVEGGGVAIVALGRATWVQDMERKRKRKSWEQRVAEDVEEGDEAWGERRLKMVVGWSADHRVVEGAELAAFVECWRSWVEAPARLIGEGI